MSEKYIVRSANGRLLLLLKIYLNLAFSSRILTGFTCLFEEYCIQELNTLNSLHSVLESTKNTFRSQCTALMSNILLFCKFYVAIKSFLVAEKISKNNGYIDKIHHGLSIDFVYS